MTQLKIMSLQIEVVQKEKGLTYIKSEANAN